MIEMYEEAIEQLERISHSLGVIGEKEDYTEVAIEALEKQVSKKPNVVHRIRGGVDRQECPYCKHKYLTDTHYEEDSYYCPTCGTYMDGISNNFCDTCGQRIDWGGTE